MPAFEGGALDPAHFPHREHVRFAYEMLTRYSFGEAVTRFARGLAFLAAKSGRPELYHETITVGFLSVIGKRRVATSHADWPDFMGKNKDLLEKDALHAWYPADQLQSPLARKTFCLPRPGARGKAEDRAGILTPALRKAINAYTIVFCAYIAWSSLKTALTASAHSSAVLGLAIAEIVAISLFLFRRTRFAALVMLLLIFAVAFTAELATGGSSLRFLLYAATVFLIWRLSSGGASKRM